MKLRSAQEQRECPEGSNVRGECAMGEASAAVGKRKRRMSSAKLGTGDAQVSKIGEGVLGSRHTDKDGKGKRNKEGKRLKQEVYRGKGRNGKGREKDNRDAVLRTVLRPVLEYGERAMERHLTLALIQAWDRWRKAFRIVGREVRFTIFDVVLFTSLPGTGKKVELDGEEVSTEVGDMVRARMGEWEREEMARRVPNKSGKKRRFFKHYVNVMMELCEENAEEDRVGIWLKLYAFIVLSGVLFPRMPYGVAWSLHRYVDDVEGMGQYAWADAIWQVVVDSIEDTQRKLCRGPLSEVQLNGLCLLIQVWFYEDTTIFSNQEGERYPCLASWRKVDHGGMYDATELLAELQESEVKPLLIACEGELQEAVVQEYMQSNEYRFYVEDREGVLSFEEHLRRVRDAYVLEKEAHDRTRAEVKLLKARVLELEERLMQSGAGEDAAGQGDNGPGGPTLPGHPRLGGRPSTVVTELRTLRTTFVLGCGEMPTALAGETEQLPQCTVDVAQDNQCAQHPPSVDVAQCGMESGAQSVPTTALLAADDGNYISQNCDNVPVPDMEPPMADKSPPAGDGGHCRAPLGMRSAMHAGHDNSSRPLSTMVSGLKKVPRVRKASRVRGSMYTDPMRRTKGGRRGPKSTTPLNVAAGEGSKLDEVPHASRSGPSGSMTTPRAHRIGSTFVICEEGVKAYLTWTFFTTELNLLTAVRAQCKGLKDNQWNFDLPEVTEKHVNAEFLKGLINALLKSPDRASRHILDTVKAQKDANLCYVFLPLFDSPSQHWLLLVADVKKRRFSVYDSLRCKRDAPRRHLLFSAKIAIGLALTKLAEFTDVLRLDMDNADCPQQENGHDCSVYMLMFMDILAMKANGLYFNSPYVHHARDKLLLSCLQGSVAHFPEVFLEGTVLAWPTWYMRLPTIGAGHVVESSNCSSADSKIQDV
ncbi:hypothetical protein Cgig2_010789 [Carnegiea gigantea]|uniref:Ubiquitin-like protease family profile domain-containing protein n=1 Tax=Carnegiea gigantea TaxID=171969 RepID=A0A9Q1JMX0_9CARY|nr:hypothetical protein Cgig2_010789 [Carnegiea gigantea]